MLFKQIFTGSCKFALKDLSIIGISIIEINRTMASEIIVLEFSLVDGPVKKTVCSLSVFLTFF